MKTSFYAVLTLLISNFNLQAQGEIQWAKTYGGIDAERGRCVQQTSDEGYIFIGETKSYGAGDRDFWLVKTDAAGDTLWTRTYGGNHTERCFSAQQTSDGGYIITGFTESYGAGDRDVWLVKTDSDGDTMWTKTFGGASEENGRSVRQTSDGGFIITGYTGSYGAGDRDVWLIKTDSEGGTLWTKTFGGSAFDVAHSVQQTHDGGYIIAGGTESFGAGRSEKSDVWLIKTNATGDTLWTKTYGDSLDNSARHIQQTSDSGYILACGTESQGFANSDFWLIKTDIEGDTVWTKTYGGPGEDDVRCVQETLDGGYIITGTYSTQVAIEDDMWWDIWLIKTDATGDTIWTRTYDGGVGDEGHFVQQTSDEGYIIVGLMDSPGDADPDVWLLKIAPDTITNIISKDLMSNPVEFILYQNYPNPFNPNAVISWQLVEGSYVELSVYNLLGQKVKILVSERQPAGYHEVEFVGQNLSSGVYFYRIEARDPAKRTGTWQDMKKMILIR